MTPVPGREFKKMVDAGTATSPVGVSYHREGRMEQALVAIRRKKKVICPFTSFEFQEELEG